MIHEKKKRRGIAINGASGALAVLVTMLATACEKGEQSAAAEHSAAPPGTNAVPSSHTAAPRAPAGTLTRVTDPSLVCMVNNQFMGRPQIPVPVAGKTYYGCCEMCKGRLANDPASRTAVDPVNQRTVDKAMAVIGRDENGAVTYFENEQNLVAYSRLEHSN